MKLLIVTSRFPYPLEKGDKLRIYHQIQELSKRNDIILCSLTETSIAPAHYQVVKNYCKEIYLFPRNRFSIVFNLLYASFKGLPAQVGFFYNPSIAKRIKKIVKIEQPDHIYCQLIRMAEYVRYLDYPKTIDYMDAFSVSAKRWANHSNFLLKPFLNREAKQVANYEKAVFDDFDRHIIISKQDRSLLSIPNRDLIQINPNGVDTDYFQPLEQKKKQYDIVFVGNMGYPPNVKAALVLAQEILPLIQKKYPSAKLLIAGARPSKEIKQLQSNSIEVSGWIDDIREAYAAAKIFIAPLFIGAGLQNKILEAMSMGIPCITTTLVNNAIGATPEKEILIANSSTEFAEKAINLLEHTVKQENLKSQALSFVHKNFSWAKYVLELEKNMMDWEIKN